MKFLKHTAAFAIGFLLLAGSAFGQGQMMQQQQSAADSVTNAELKKFASVMMDFQQLQRQSMKQVQSMLSDKEMNMQRFQQILMSQRNPNSPDTLNVTPQEKKTVQSIQRTMQQQSRKKMQQTFKNNDMNQQRFQAIQRAIQSNPSLKKRFRQVMMQQQQQGQGSQN